MANTSGLEVVIYSFEAAEEEEETVRELNFIDTYC